MKKRDVACMCKDIICVGVCETPPQWANLGLQAVELNQYRYLPYFHVQVVTIMTGHLKDNIFVFTPLHGGPRGSPPSPFLAR